MRKKEDVISRNLKVKAECVDCAFDGRCHNYCGCINWKATGDLGKIPPVLCESQRRLIPIADRVAEILYREGNIPFFKRHYCPNFPLISAIEDVWRGESGTSRRLEMKDDRLHVKPVKDYKGPEVPRMEEVKSRGGIFEKLSRAAVLASMLFSVGLGACGGGGGSDAGGKDIGVMGPPPLLPDTQIEDVITAKDTMADTLPLDIPRPQDTGNDVGVMGPPPILPDMVVEDLDQVKDVIKISDVPGDVPGI